MAALLDKARRVSISESPHLAPMWEKMFARSKVMADLAQKTGSTTKAKPVPGSVAALEAEANELELENRALRVQIDRAKAQGKAA
jgi:hypothetical protein